MTITTYKKLTLDEYLKYDDGTDNGYEYDDGYLIFQGQIIEPYQSLVNLEESILKGFPLGKHEETTWFMSQIFNQEIQRLKLDWVARPSKIGVPTVMNKNRIPDVCVYYGGDWRKIREESAILKGIPLLLVEVVSEGTKVLDYRYKFAEYQAIGISEYWIIDFFESKITILNLMDGLYESQVFDENQPEILSKVFPELQLKVSQVFEV